MAHRWTSHVELEKPAVLLNCAIVSHIQSYIPNMQSTYKCLLLARKHACLTLFVLLDVGRQSHPSSSPRPLIDTPSPATWSRQLIQQTLMDEGLRLARMMSHDHVGKGSLGSERKQTAGECMDTVSTTREPHEGLMLLCSSWP